MFGPRRNQQITSACLSSTIGWARPDPARLCLARLGQARLSLFQAGLACLSSGLARLVLPRPRPAWLGSAHLSPAWLGLARPGLARLGSPMNPNVDFDAPLLDFGGSRPGTTFFCLFVFLV